MARRLGSRLAPKTKAAAVAAGRDQRVERDAYLTPEKCSLAICKTLADVLKWPGDVENVRPPRIIEPSAGTGSFVAAARTVWPASTLVAVDLYNGHAQALHKAGATSYVIGDWLAQRRSNIITPDLIVGNPPYSDAEEHTQHALNILPDGGHLAFLLPMSFLCGQDRTERLWSQRNLRYIIPLAQRPGFITGKGTDMTEYMVAVWRKGWCGNAEQLPHLWWRERTRKAKPLILPEAA